MSIQQFDASILKEGFIASPLKCSRNGAIIPNGSVYYSIIQAEQNYGPDRYTTDYTSAYNSAKAIIFALGTYLEPGYGVGSGGAVDFPSWGFKTFLGFADSASPTYPGEVVPAWTYGGGTTSPIINTGWGVGDTSGGGFTSGQVDTSRTRWMADYQTSFAWIEFRYDPADPFGTTPLGGVIYQRSACAITVPGAIYEAPWPLIDASSVPTVQNVDVQFWYDNTQAEINAYAASQGWTIVGP